MPKDSIHRAWIYCLWGDANHPQCIASKAEKARRNFEWAAKRPMDPHTIVYVFGTQNQEFLKGLGFETVLLSPDPVPLAAEQPGKVRIWWHHKVHAWLAALKDFDEIVYRDCDIRAWTPIDAAAEEHIWQRLRQKGPILANLIAYPNPENNKAPWRPGFSAVPDLHLNRIASGSFVYLRDRQVVMDLLELATVQHRDDDEALVSHWVDNQHGGWQGLEHWAENYEPFCCHVKSSGLLVQGSQHHAMTAALGKFIAQKQNFFTYWESDCKAWEYEAI